MITQREYETLEILIDRYLADESSVTIREIREVADRLTPTSPKSGKEITFGTMCNYLRNKIPSHCNKYDLLYVLAFIKQTNKIKPDIKVGFFTA